MISNHVNAMRAKLRAGEVALGAGITMSDPTVTEALAPLVDFFWIDLEHNATTTESMLGHLIAARAGGAASIVRIPSNEVGWVKRVLDSGAEGIILPRAYNAKEVAEFVSACRYPPLGTRGYGPRRPMKYGLLNQQEYIQQANQDVFVCAQLETVELFSELDEVLAIEGPDVIEVMKTAAAKAKAAGKFIGSGLGANPAFARVLIDCGVQWMQAGNDFEYMLQGCRRVFHDVRGVPQS